MDQRARFAAVLAFMGPIKDVLNLGYKGQTAGRATGFNMGIQYALNYAVLGTYPNYTIDQSKVQIAKGTLQAPSNVQLSSTQAEELNISWSSQINILNAFGDDNLIILLYNETQHFFLIYTDVAVRADNSCTLNIPTDFSGQQVHAYLFYTMRDGTRQSLSTYVSPTTIV